MAEPVEPIAGIFLAMIVIFSIIESPS
jgi:hypothetical protein